jgi:multimeric flavodoxin WrbA
VFAASSDVEVAVLDLSRYWYQVSSPVKLMMDRLVCADGGNPDPTGTQGKNAELAKQIELEGWDYPRRYWKPCATSHAELDADTAIQEEVRNAARTLLEAVRGKLRGTLVAAGENLRPPRQK